VEITKLWVTLALDARQYTSALSQTMARTRQWAGNIATSLTRGIQTAVKGAAIAIGTLGAAAVAGGIALLNMGSDAAEMQSKFNVVFANFGNDVTAQLRSFADQAGRSIFELKAMASTFGDTLKPMGFTEEAAADMSVVLTELATDLSSFNNMPMDEALQRLQGTLIGSHENALAFGVIINENTLAAELAAMGADNLTGSQLELAKVQARVNILLRGTTDAQGDAIRTAAGFANQTRALTSRFVDFATEIGISMLPAVEGVMASFGNLLNIVLPKLTTFFEMNVLPVLLNVGNGMKAFVDAIVAGEGPVSALGAAIVTMFPPATAAKILSIVNKIIEFKNAVIEFIKPIKDFAAQWVTAKDILIAAGIAIAITVLPALASLLATFAPIIIGVGLLVAAVTAMRLAWETDFLGIRTAVENALVYIRDNIIVPVITFIATFWALHGEKIMQVTTTVWSRIKKEIKHQLEQAKQNFDIWRLAFEGDWFAFGQGLGTQMREAILRVIKAWTWGFVQVKNILTTARDDTGKIDWSVVGKNLMTTLTNGIKAGAQAFLNEIASIVAFAQGLIDGIRFGGSGAAGANVGTMTGGAEGNSTRVGTRVDGGGTTINNNTTVNTSAPPEQAIRAARHLDNVSGN